MSDTYEFFSTEADGIKSDRIRAMKRDAITRDKNKPTREEYRGAIEQLLWLANLGTGGSLPAALVLLSAYCGSSFQIRTDLLGALDGKHLDAALTVIKARTLLGEEPHNLIENGGNIFQSMAEKHSRFNRSKD